MTKRPERQADGFYHIKGKKYPQLFGSRQQVWNGTAYKTEGELTKDAFIMNKHRRIVSKTKHLDGKKNNNLLKHGYSAKKGKFGYVKVAPKVGTRKNKRKQEEMENNKRQKI